MNLKIKDKLNYFLKNDEDYPILSGFSVGFYAMVFYFSNNFDLVNSWEQTLIFLFYYIIVSVGVVFVISKIIEKSKYNSFVSQAIFVSMLLLLPIYLFGISNILDSNKKMGLVLILILSLFIFKIKNYKYCIVLLFLMSVIPVIKLGKIIYLNYTNSTEWKLQPDAILKAEFKKKPNIYYIQPDGYAGEVNLKGNLYRYDNSAFDTFLKEKKFTLYPNYRSNYESTLFSNSSCFFMKHHFSNEFSKFKYARDLIIGENPVLKILKNNNYKTFFITERPYLLMNRPEVFYDYCNFKVGELPYLSDGWSDFREITNTIKTQIINNKDTNNFFFIEKFKPGHIATYKFAGTNKEKERIKYIESIEEANQWLQQIIVFIEAKDPGAMIIIGADHGGFVGFDYALEAQKKVTDSMLIQSIFGAKLAIKWNNVQHSEYDSKLKTPVNLFRTVFSFLSEDKNLLNHLQPDASYNCYDPTDFTKVYKAIDENGSTAKF